MVVNVPVVRKRQDEFNTMLRRRLDDIVKALQALWSLIQSPITVIPDLIVRKVCF